MYLQNNNFTHWKLFLCSKAHPASTMANLIKKLETVDDPNSNLQADSEAHAEAIRPAPKSTLHGDLFFHFNPLYTYYSFYKNISTDIYPKVSWHLFMKKCLILFSKGLSLCNIIFVILTCLFSALTEDIYTDKKDENQTMKSRHLAFMKFISEMYEKKQKRPRNSRISRRKTLSFPKKLDLRKAQVATTNTTIGSRRLSLGTIDSKPL